MDSKLHDASSEGDLIDRWLDEGDRMSEQASAVGVATHRRRRVEAVGGLRGLANRRRFSFVLGAIAVAAIGVVGMRALAHAFLATDQAVASAPPRPPEPLPSPVAPVAPVATTPAAPPPVPVPGSAPAPEPLAFASEPEPPPKKSSIAAAVPGATTKPAVAGASDALQECQGALRRERAKAAVVACEKVAQDQPASADALVLLAHADLLAGWEGETLRLARRASFLDPKCADAYLLIGTVEQAAGRTPAARRAYEDYLHLAPRGSHATEIRAILRTL